MSKSALARRQEEVGKLLLDINDDVARLPIPALRALYPALVDAEKELAADLGKWLAKQGADERFTTFKLRQSLYQVRGALKKIKEIAPEMTAGMRRGAMAAAPLAQKHLQQELAKLSFRFAESLSPIPLLQAASVSQNLLASRFRKASDKWSDRVQADVRHKLALGLVRGETIGQMTQRLLGPQRSKFGIDSPPADKSKAIAERFFSKARYEAERVVRTEVINAYNVIKDESIRELAKEDPGYKRRWDAAIDGRTCPICRDLDGQVAEVDKEFPGGYMHPPAHPFCRCAVVAWHEDWSKT